MRQLAGFILFALLVSCAPLAPPLAERGIGGTGSPGGTSSPGSPAAPPLATAERGIGGTGNPQGPAGTGIVGVITGFGSIFVDGFEVRYSAATPLDIDGAPASTSALRTGQVVVIDAAGSPTALEAQSLSVRHEVSGPVESVSPDGREAQVAGQRIALDSSPAGAALLSPGAWVAVSGLRQPDGAISATRIGPSPSGLVRVHGLLTQGPGGLRVGALPVQPAPGIHAGPGQYVTLSGRYEAGRLLAASSAPDRLATNPFAHFGPHVGRIFVESYVSAANGRLSTPGGLSVRAAPALGTASLTPRWSVLTLERGAGGTPRATGLRFLERPALPPAAPSPGLNRSFHQGSIEGFRPGLPGQPLQPERFPEPASRAYVAPASQGRLPAYAAPPAPVGIVPAQQGSAPQYRRPPEGHPPERRRPCYDPAGCGPDRSP